jgi:serine/threonine protein kinase/tetratricopeptide (TPR) repeat protein
MSAERLDKIVDEFLDQLTSGAEPRVDLNAEGLTEQEREELKLCMEAARWVESAIVQDSLQRMSSSGIMDVVGAELGETLPADAVEAGERDEEFAAGKTLGDFEIIREIGRGGMGIVFEARQKSLDRLVALKVLPPGAGWNKTALERFLREARAAAQLQHSHIIPVYQIAEEKGVHYFAMQLIDGFPLSRLARSNVVPRSDGGSKAEHDAGTGHEWPGQVPLPSEPEYYRFVARAMCQVASGIEYAHRQGVLHRDVKPSNLIVDQKGDVWIADFGLARLSTDASVTMSGQLIGTLNYMSPEQAAGGKTVGPHSDIYSLGATLYELLALRTPFVAKSTQDLLNAILDQDPARPTKVNPRVPADLEVIALTAMEKDPQHRYVSAGAMAVDLQRWQDDLPIQARPATVWRIGRKWVRRRRMLVGAAAVVLAVLVGASWITSTATRKTGEAQQRFAEAEQRRAEGEVSTGRIRFEQRDYEGAKESFTDAARIFSKFLTGTDKLAGAIAAPVRAGVEAWPHIYLGLIALRDQNAEAQADAARQFASALRLAPNNPLLKSLKLLAETRDYDQYQSIIRAVENLPQNVDWGPFAADAFYALAVAVEHYDLRAAIRLTTMAMDYRTAFFEALGYRGWLHYQAGDLQEALTDLNNVLVWDKRPEYHIWRGKVHAASGRASQARADFDRAVELAPDSFAAQAERLIWLAEDLGYKSRLSAGSTGGQTSSLPQALAEQLAALERLAPTTYEELHYLSLVYEAYGLEDRVAFAVQRAVEAVPPGAGGYVAGAVYWQAARQAERQGRPDSALGWYDRALAACPHREFFKYRGDFRASLGDYEGALRDYRDAERRGAETIDLRISEAKALRHLGEFAASLEALGVVLGQEPTHWVALDLKAANMLSLGDRAGAIDTLGTLHRAYPHDFRVLYKRAQAKLLAGDEQGGLEDMRAGIERGLPAESPESAVGEFWEGMGRTDEALRYYARALEEDAALHGARIARINIFSRTGRVPDALAECDRALSITPGAPGVLMTRAELCERCGREEDAIADLRRLLESNPGYEPALWNLARLLLYAKDVSLRDLEAVEQLVAGRRAGGRKLTQTDHRILGHLRFKQGLFRESAGEMAQLGEREVADWFVLAGLQSRGFDVGGAETGPVLPEEAKLTLPGWLRELGDRMQILGGATGEEKTKPLESEPEY